VECLILSIQNWIELTDITEEDREFAKALAMETIKAAQVNGLTPRFQSNALQNGVNGVIGQIKFGKYIEVEPTFTIGVPDLYDFKINGKIVDIKTNDRQIDPKQLSNNYNFLINRDQVNKHQNIDIYVSMMVHKDKIWLCGFITRKDVLTYPITNPGFAFCYTIPFRDLQDPHDLLKVLGIVGKLNQETKVLEMPDEVIMVGVFKGGVFEW
jgi:hypothetical protein